MVQRLDSDTTIVRLGPKPAQRKHGRRINLTHHRHLACLLDIVGLVDTYRVDPDGQDMRPDLHSQMLERRVQVQTNQQNLAVDCDGQLHGRVALDVREGDVWRSGV